MIGFYLLKVLFKCVLPHWYLKEIASFNIFCASYLLFILFHSFLFFISDAAVWFLHLFNLNTPCSAADVVVGGTSDLVSLVKRV